jgi:DNA-directed RNA polymerase subunit RPC12/RpoP
MAVNERIKVIIRCKRCGERFVLKGRKDNDRIDTGFKQCVCSNEKDFIIETKCF